MIPAGEPAFAVSEPLRQAAWDNGFRHDAREEGPWLSFASTTARGRIWLAGASQRGPWWLAVDHPGVAAEFGPGVAVAGPGLSIWRFEDKAGLYRALDRAYRLGGSLPDAPLDEFRRQTAGMPRTTEAERLTIERIGQPIFRAALDQYWGETCAVTGLTDRELLRASHIVPWARCETDFERLDVHNGLLLSALWDAAFDAGLVTFDGAGKAQFSTALSAKARGALGGVAVLRRQPLPKQVVYLQWHREDVFIR